MGCTISSHPVSKPQKYTEPRKELTHNEYDARIITESFYPLLLGKCWPIEVKANDWPGYVAQTKRDTVQLAVVGYEKTGKTFLLSKLMERPLPQDKHYRTSGLCVLYPNQPDYPWTAVDIPGINTSFHAEDMKKETENYFKEKDIPYDEMIKMLLDDNVMMEALLQEFVIHHSQIALIVVNKLKRDDHRLISRIKGLPNVKRIIIVHNLSEYQDRTTVEEIIKEDIFGVFNATQQVIRLVTHNEGNNIIYTENDLKRIQHIIMAQEATPAGIYYNESAIAYIRQVINAANDRKPFDLINAFAEYLNTNVKKYFSLREDITYNKPIQLQKDENGVPTGLVLRDNMKYDHRLNLISEEGDVQMYVREGLDVPFSVKIVDQKDGSSLYKVLKIEFEVVGTCYDDELYFKIHEQNDHVKIVVHGTSKDSVRGATNAQEHLLQSTRKFGNFRIATEQIYIGGYTINKAEKPTLIQELLGLKSISWNLIKLDSVIL